MAIRMMKKILNNFNYQFYLLCIITFIFYIPALNTEPFGDDLVEIFKSWILKKHDNPFLFWIPSDIHFKSWPLTYSLLWILFKTFKYQYFLYRIVNICIHLLSTYFLGKIFDEFKVEKNKKIFLLSIFTLHPLAVESIVWIFQFKTLISTLFFIISFYFFIRNERYDSSKSILFFLMSILSKNSFVFAPIALFFFSKENSKSKIILKLLPFLIISVFSTIITLKGISTRKNEITSSKQYEKFLIKDSKDISSPDTIYLRTDRKLVVNDLDSYLNGVIAYVKNLISVDKIFIKYGLIADNFVFYSRLFLGIGQYWPIYKKTDFNSFIGSFTIYLFSILIFLFLFYVLDHDIRKKIFLLLLVFLPISGLFYVPYFKFSSVADHYIYSALFIFVLILQRIIQNRRFYIFFILVLSIQTFSYTFRYSNTYKLFSENLKYYPNALIHEYLAQNTINTKPSESLEHAISANLISPNRLNVISYVAAQAKDINNAYIFRDAQIQKSKLFHYFENYQASLNELNSIPSELSNFEGLVLKSSVYIADNSNYDLLKVYFNDLKKFSTE